MGHLVGLNRASNRVRAIASIVSIVLIASITSITSNDPPAASFSGRDDCRRRARAQPTAFLLAKDIQGARTQPPRIAFACPRKLDYQLRDCPHKRCVRRGPAVAGAGEG